MNKSPVSGVECSTETEVREYLNSFGLKLGDCAFDEVTVPYEFNDVYNNYNKIQQSQGFDLTELKGKAVHRYTFSVQNYSEGERVFAEVLIYDNKIVGADIYSTDSSGFMVPLK